MVAAAGGRRSSAGGFTAGGIDLERTLPGGRRRGEGSQRLPGRRRTSHRPAAGR